MYTFNTLARRPRAEVIAISIRDIIEQYKKDKNRAIDLLSMLLREFYNLADVFLAAAADKLPLLRGLVDHYINLLLGKTLD